MKINATRSGSRLALCAGVVACLFAGCVSSETRRIHAENMVKAEEFKRVFDQRVPTGTPLSVVDEYLLAQKLRVGRAIGATGAGDLIIEAFSEKSPNWFCGVGSVGLTAQFGADQRLRGTQVSYWSMDCP